MPVLCTITLSTSRLASPISSPSRNGGSTRTRTPKRPFARLSPPARFALAFSLHSQIQFNAGFWSLVDISLVDYHELISVITAGRLWVMEVFHVVVNTGIILGGYAYPAVILDAIRQSGVEFLIVYHTATNTMYTMDDPMGPFYAHGGLQADGKSVSPNPNLFLFGDADGEMSDMVVQLSYGEDSQIVNNLVSIGCTSGAN